MDKVSDVPMFITYVEVHSIITRNLASDCNELSMLKTYLESLPDRYTASVYQLDT